jgi:predicted ATPase
MLTSLRLIGFKNFRDATLNMGPLTLVVGANASGKSNLRDALRFLHGIGRGYSLADILGGKYGDGGEQQWSGIRGGTREVAFEGGETFALEVGFRVLPSEENLVYRITVHVGESGAPPEAVKESLIRRDYLKVQDTVEVRDFIIFDAHLIQAGLELVNPSKPPPEHVFRAYLGLGLKSQTNWQIECLSYRSAVSQIAEDLVVPPSYVHQAARETLNAFSSMRFLDLDPDALRRPSLPGQTVLGDKGQNLSSVLQAICNKPELKAALASWIAELTPMDAVDFEFPADQTGRILVTLVEKSGRRISAYSASDGTLRFLAMIAALLGPDSSRFYFFEELDNGIHPARLHLLLNLIERQASLGKVQVVATTHSPELLALLDRKTLEHASLIYRLPHSPEGRIKRILDIPGAADLIGKQDLAKLHATGWLEDAAYFTSEDEETAE